MNQKNQRGNGSDIGNGLNFNGWFPLAISTFKPELFLLLTGNELKLFLYLTFLSWRYPEPNGSVRAAATYLERGTGLARETVKRCLKSLQAKQLLRLERRNHENGNHYRVYSVLLGPTEKIGPTQRDRTVTPRLAQKEPTVSSKRANHVKISGTRLAQNEPQDLHSYSFLQRDAVSHGPKNGSEGGVEVPASKEAREQRSPTGQIKTPGQGKEGVGLPADPIIEKIHARIRSKHFDKSESVEQPLVG